ncbi:hypothetical protein JW823_02350 [bacterium]|nr:hypothetical protein [candidate division CSSED10-310 bacterium]
MNRYFASIVLFTLAAVPVWGMSQYNKDDITIPPENYIVEIVDIDGVITRGENVTYDDQTLVSGTRGSTEVFIPFERIQSIDLTNNEDVITRELKDIKVNILLNDGSSLEINGKCHKELTGESDFGRFRIRLDHIRRVSILEKKQSPVGVEMQ